MDDTATEHSLHTLVHHHTIRRGKEGEGRRCSVELISRPNFGLNYRWAWVLVVSGDGTSGGMKIRDE